MSIVKEPFGVTQNGEAISQYTMTNSNGITVAVLDYAAVIRSILVPGKDGEPVDVVLGYDDLAGYESGNCFYGAFVGRYANRIKGAAFRLNGKTYELPKNDGSNHLHGTYAHQKFDCKIVGNSLVFTKVSPDGEEGYPGSLSMTLTYTLTEDNRLELDYKAVSDQDTVVNFTNHSYFNLSGAASGDMLDQELYLNCASFTEGNSETIPTGRILSVADTPFDFRQPKTIGRDIFADDKQLTMCRGYDHNLIFSEVSDRIVQARAYSPKSGVEMTMFTTQPATQLYTGNFVDGDTADQGKGGVRYPRYAGFCLETQHYPCSPNFDHFPTTTLKAGETYHQVTVYQFGVR